MSNIQIRPADTHDSTEIAKLSGELGYPSRVEDLINRLNLILQKDDHMVLAAEVDGKVVGWVHVFVAFRVESPAFSEIGGLVVTHTERGKGIGKSLVVAAANWAHKRGVGKIRVRCNLVRGDTHAFYLHLGFQKLKTQEVFTMAIALE
jgi:predicted N-acetyltransferase YhbS